MWTMQFYKFEKPQRLLTSGGLGTMGYGLGAAIGGCIANGRKRTVLFTGDGSFGMNLNEMATAVSQNLPPTIVVMNNDVFRHGETVADDLLRLPLLPYHPGPEDGFPSPGSSLRGKGVSAHTMEELKKALDEADQSDGPVLIDCHIGMDEKVLPMIPPGRSARDMIVKG